MKSVPIKLDKQRSLRYSNNAIMLFEDTTGISLIGNSNNEPDFTFRQSLTLIWAGLYHEDKTLTVEDVADLIDDYSDIETVMTTAEKALMLAFEGKSKKNNQNNNHPK